MSIRVSRILRLIWFVMFACMLVGNKEKFISTNMTLFTGCQEEEWLKYNKRKHKKY